MLTKYNDQTITYDAIGNPLIYRDGITMTWQNGRELATFEQDDVDVTYTYDPSGLRTRKLVVEDFVTTDYNYVYENGLLMQMTYGNHIFNFSYDSSGLPISLNHIIPNSGLNEYYYYGVNARGDVEALYYSDGSLYVTYDYDAYGKLMSITNSYDSDLTNTDTVATKNPLRYRSYVYDTETGLYYLQSRYYDPTTCRFINADVFYETGQGINGYNMFAYCNNNPIMYSDLTGTRIFECCPYGNCDSCRAAKKTSSVSTSFIIPPYSKPADGGKVDITDKLNEAMVNNSNEFAEYRKENSYIDSALFFMNQVQPGGEWDFKSQDEWDLSPDTIYVYDGTELRFDDIGNIHYGYVGRVMFHENILLIMGGVVQVYTKTSKWEYWNANFDDPRDQWAIEFGSSLWDKGV